MRRLAILLITTATAMAGACAGTVETSGTVVATTGGGYYEPDLVYVSPGVSVIADYNEPVFYADNFYWRYYGGAWYRSNYYNRGWVSYARPPGAITRIDRPYAYRNYHPHGYTARTHRSHPVSRPPRTYDRTPDRQPPPRTHDRSSDRRPPTYDRSSDRRPAPPDHRH